jgi:hypothetical protein
MDMPEHHQNQLGPAIAGVVVMLAVTGLFVGLLWSGASHGDDHGGDHAAPAGEHAAEAPAEH